MKMPLESVRRVFISDLEGRAAKKKLALKAAKKTPVKKVEKIAAPDLLTEVRGNSELLKKIHALLKQRGGTGSVEFVVTERDGDGNVKSFKVLNG